MGVDLFLIIRYSSEVMVNRMRHTRAHTANRRSHHALKEQNISMCSECGAPKMNHMMCANCGKYNKRSVVDVQAVLVKKEEKRKARNKALGTTSDNKSEEK